MRLENRLLTKTLALQLENELEISHSIPKNKISPRHEPPTGLLQQAQDELSRQGRSSHQPE